MRLRWTTLLGIAGLVLALPAAGYASYPGANGKIAFERAGQIWAINADGTGAVQLTSDAAPSSEPEWSPNGKLIAFTRGTGSQREVRVMDADGTDDHLVVGNATVGTYSPTWSPDGSRIGYAIGITEDFPQSCGCTRWYVDSVDPAGGSFEIEHYGMPSSTSPYGPVGDLEWSSKATEFLFTNGTEGIDRKVAGAYGNETIAGDSEAFGGALSPDAATVAWAQHAGSPTNTLFTRARSGGTPQPSGSVGDKVEWSPSGTRLVFDLGGDLYTSDPDGTARLQITSTPGAERTPDWQPVIDAPDPGYPRPKGAAVLKVPLVVAYRPCSAPNRTHGPPLAFASCNPPVLGSNYLTVGTPDANGAPAETLGSVRFDVHVGNPATPANEADLGVNLSINDVHCRFEIHPGLCDPPASSAGELYSGRVQTDVELKVTDRYNLPSQAGRAPGTINQVFLRFPTSCRTTYGNCEMNTTVNAVMGSVIQEGRRSVWEFKAVRVWDEHQPSGPPAGVFMTQGIFVP